MKIIDETETQTKKQNKTKTNKQTIKQTKTEKSKWDGSYSEMVWAK